MQMKLMAQAVCAAIGVLVAGGAYASGFQLQEQNASGLGNAYAGSAANAENASIIFYNPAGMTRLEGKNFASSVNMLKPSYKFKNSGSSDYPASTGSDGGDAGGIYFLPAVYASWQLDEKWFAGIGMGSPFGLRTDYDKDWTGRFQSTLFDIKTYNINPSLAFKATEKLSLGVGLDWERMEATYKRNAAVAVAAPYAALSSQAQSTEVALTVQGEAWGWNAGALYKVSPTTDIGFSYRSRMFENLHGELNSSNQTISQNSLASTSMVLPDTYILSVTQQLDERWTMLGDVSRTNWSTVDKVVIQRNNGTTVETLDANFRDTWRFALGGTYKLNDKWNWKLGFAYDQSPVRGAEERLVSLPDNNRYWYTTGIQWKADTRSTVDVGLAYLHIPKTNISNNESTAGRGTVDGTYTGSIVIFGLQYSVQF